MTVKARRSLKASAAGIRRANRAVLVFATKIDLAAELEISRATVQNFFAAKPIGRENFHKICQALNLPWQEIADLSEDDSLNGEPAFNHECNALPAAPGVHRLQPEAERAYLESMSAASALDSSSAERISVLRQQISSTIQQHCSSLRVLDMSGPRPLHQIYTEVKLLEKISSRQRISRSELLKMSEKSPEERLELNCTAQTPLPGLQLVAQHSKLIILGRPGAGKTTFLKYIALECIAGNFFADRVPLFISLKTYGELATSCSLFSYITQTFATISAINSQLVAEAIFQGKALLLLDGLDEVKSDDRSLVFQALRQFIAQFHTNHFVITCRLAAQDYVFEQFTEVEIAHFDSAQVISFAQKWFADRDAILQLRFIHALQANRPLLDLASNPLLLTLLCLIFEDSVEFPSNRAMLYQEVLQVLLKTWDTSRDIERDAAVQTLSLVDKEDLLSQIALLTFERQEHFFLQQELEQWIGQWIACKQQQLHSTPLSLSADTLLKSLESRHGLLIERAKGIYAFPCAIFHEYFVARGIVAQARLSSFEIFLHRFLDQITAPHWREVFLLIVEMLNVNDRDALPQLLTQKMDTIAQSANVEEFSHWLTQKVAAISPTTRSDEITVRSLYVELELSQTLGLQAPSRSPTLSINLESSFMSFLEINTHLKLDWLLADLLKLTHTLCQITCENALQDLALLIQAKFLVRKLTVTIEEAVKVAPILAIELQRLQQQLPNLRDCAELNPKDLHPEKKSFPTWWMANGQTWTQQLSATVQHHRYLGNRWSLNADQEILLKQYYQVNQLLVSCLSYFTVSPRDQLVYC